MLHRIFVFVVMLGAGMLQAQQLPDFTHYPSMLFTLNPAYTGTKGNIDIRTDYRKQWVGYEGAPTVQTFGIHSRFLKGKLGAGALIYKDVTGPSQRFNYSFTSAFHLHFPDVEVCAGIGLNFTKYTFNSANVTMHNSQDPALIENTSDYDKTVNGMAGILLYNDRFHFGLSVNNMISQKAEFYIADTSKKMNVTYTQHYYFTVGYNFSGNPDFVWENNLMTIFVGSAPMTINYSLRLHLREQLILGGALRLKDAIAPQVGYTFAKKFQIIYAYDFGISKLRTGHKNTHEVVLGFRHDFNAGGGKRYHGGKDFQRQRYNLF